MRRFARLIAVVLLAACQLQVPKLAAPGEQVTPLGSDAITVTTLGGPPAGAAKPMAQPAGKPVTTNLMPPAIPAQVPDKATQRPRPRPAGLIAQTPVAVPPKPPAPVVAPISPDQAKCERSKGQWSEMPNSSGHLCVHQTRDSGKSCRKKGDCQGECLATSGTCSPIIPLVGCNEILQADGSQVTLCLQ